MHSHFLAPPGQIAVQYHLDDAAVLFPDLGRFGAPVDVALQSDHEVQGGLHLGRTDREALLLGRYQVVQNLLEESGTAGAVEGKPRKGDKRLAQQTGLEPGQAGVDHSHPVVPGNEPVGAAPQLLAIVVNHRKLGFVAVEAAFELGGILFSDGCGEHHRTARGKPHTEQARGKQVFGAVETAAVLVGVGDAVVPAGKIFPLGLGIAELEVEVGEIGIHTERHSSGDVLAGGVGLGVLRGKGVGVAERQERLEDERHGHRRGQELVLDEHLVLVKGQNEALAENHVSDLVGDVGHRVLCKIDDILVAAGLIDVTVAVDAQVELLAADHQTFVKRGQKHIVIPAEAVEGHGKKAVVAAGIAPHDGGIAIRARLVGADNLALERI